MVRERQATEVACSKLCSKPTARAYSRPLGVAAVAYIGLNFADWLLTTLILGWGIGREVNPFWANGFSTLPSTLLKLVIWPLLILIPVWLGHRYVPRSGFPYLVLLVAAFVGAGVAINNLLVLILGSIQAQLQIQNFVQGESGKPRVASMYGKRPLDLLRVEECTSSAACSGTYRS